MRNKGYKAFEMCVKSETWWNKLFEARLQFLQEVYSIFSENNLKECNVRVSCICHCRLQRNALNAINLFALSQTATFSKKFSFRFNSIPTKSDVFVQVQFYTN